MGWGGGVKALVKLDKIYKCNQHCVISTLAWPVGNKQPPLLCSHTGLLVDSIFLISRFCCNRVCTLMISDKGTKQELSTESTFPDIPDFSSFVLELLQGPVT